MSTTKPQMNGTRDGSKYIDSIDVDDPEYIREMRRPVEVKQDVRQMEERRRVNMILKSRAFRHELEGIVVEQLKTGPQEQTQQQTTSTQALQQIAEMFPAQMRFQRVGSGQSNGPVVPISDFGAEDIPGCDKVEKLLRCKLASCLRLVDMFGWSHGNDSYITARCGDNEFLTVAQGAVYLEVTATKLVKCNQNGQDLSGSRPIDKNSYELNAAVHAARQDIKCCIYLHNSSASAVSVMECGLLPLSQDAMSLGIISYCDYSGSGDGSASAVIREAIGPVNKVLIVRNSGVLVGGETVEEAFHMARSVMNAIETQMRTIPLGLENIHLPSEEKRKKAFERANKVSPATEDGKRRWMRGELEFEALMRHLENSGYKTGYVFHAPLVRQAERVDRVNSEVEVPPSSTSFAYSEDDQSGDPHKERLKKGPKADWLNSPNAYKKEEIEQKGVPHAKKITKWIPEKAPGTLIKIESPNQFAPIGTDPKELKSKFREIRKDHYDENITSGPSSKILEGVTWEEAQRIKEGHVASDTIIVVGAASRGIIQREHQTTANTYKTYYAPNPFENMTEEDVDEYRATISRNSNKRGDTGLTTEDEDDPVVPGPDGRLISSDERMQQVRQTQAEAAGRITPEVKQQPITIAPQLSVEEVRRAASEETRQSLPPISPTRPLAKPEEAAVRSPAKSISSGDGTHGDQSGTDAGTGREQETPTPASGTEKKKKKRGFRMPSFSSKKKDKQ